nr:hypothetical protein [Desulfuromonadales bacterium]
MQKLDGACAQQPAEAEEQDRQRDDPENETRQMGETHQIDHRHRHQNRDDEKAPEREPEGNRPLVRHLPKPLRRQG